MNWSYLRELAGDVFIVGYGTFMLWAFLTIFSKGGFMFAVEPDTALLALEILLTLGVVALGLERFWGEGRPKRLKRRDENVGWW